VENVVLQMWIVPVDLQVSEPAFYTTIFDHCDNIRKCADHPLDHRSE